MKYLSPDFIIVIDILLHLTQITLTQYLNFQYLRPPLFISVRMFWLCTVADAREWLCACVDDSEFTNTDSSFWIFVFEFTTYVVLDWQLTQIETILVLRPRLQLLLMKSCNPHTWSRSVDIILQVSWKNDLLLRSHNFGASLWISSLIENINELSVYWVKRWTCTNRAPVRLRDPAV